jgi:hypothetical protein
MQIDHQPTKILLVGKSGSGKSTYQIRYLKNAKYDTIFIFDHKLEILNRLGIQPAYSVEECEEKLKRGEKYISYSHVSDYPGDSESAFQFYCAWCYAVTRARVESGFTGKSLFACDEVNRFTGTGTMGYDFQQLIEDGRLWGLDFIGSAHSANAIHNKLRQQLSEIVALRTRDGRPLEFLVENGFDEQEVKSLPVGSYVILNCDTEEFTRGKLFSCARAEKSVEPETTTKISTPETEKENALPASSNNSLPVHRHGSPGQSDYLRDNS